MNLPKKIAKHYYYKITRPVGHLRKGIKCKSQWYGNHYGGFYAIPELLNPDSIVYSFGIGEDISFDQSIIEEHNCNLFGFDPTPKSINWIKNNETPKKFHFYNYGIDKVSGTAHFYLPKNPDHVSGSTVSQSNVSTQNKIEVQMKSFLDICQELGHSKVNLVKMDIEGSEYNVLDSILASGIIIDQILIEFHDRFFTDDKVKSKKAIASLQKHGYEIFAVSKSFEEISLVRKESVLTD